MTEGIAFRTRLLGLTFGTRWPQGTSSLNAKLVRDGRNEGRALSAESAGLLLYRQRDGTLEVLLVHPGGPFWQKRDDGVWSIPKGESAENDVGIDVARREFQEELGTAPPAGAATPLGEVRQKGGKVVS